MVSSTYRRPANGNDLRLLLGKPGVPDSRPPHDIVAPLLKYEGANFQIDSEPASDEQENSGAVLDVVPGVALLAGMVKAPLQFDISGQAYIPRTHEMANEPASVVYTVRLSVAYVPKLMLSH